jgi:hypothetical protein
MRKVTQIIGRKPAPYRGLEDKKPNKIDETLIGMTLAMCRS